MKEYKRCLDMIRTHLNDKTIELNEEKLDSIIGNELEKPKDKMDTDLIDHCLAALVAYRKYISKHEKKN